jgi:hypothetical protein
MGRVEEGSAGFWPAAAKQTPVSSAAASTGRRASFIKGPGKNCCR